MVAHGHLEHTPGFDAPRVLPSLTPQPFRGPARGRSWRLIRKPVRMGSRESQLMCGRLGANHFECAFISALMRPLPLRLCQGQSRPQV